MKIKTFSGRTMSEALSRVKADFGPHAVILSTRSTERVGVLGITGKQPLVEITAARQMEDLPLPLQRSTIPATAPKRQAVTSSPSPGPTADGRRAGGFGPPKPARSLEGVRFGCVPATAVSPGTGDRDDVSPRTLMDEMGALRNTVQDLVRSTRRDQVRRFPRELYKTYESLVNNAVAEELASAIIHRLQEELTEHERTDGAIVRRRLLETLRRMIPTVGPIHLAGPGEPTIIALVGPTGVGKTTTIAKLAANACLRERKKVGLITIDTYRIAAVEQLKTYARIIDVPIHVALTPNELMTAVESMGDRDVIFIDSAGRGQRDNDKIADLCGFFRVVRPHEVHLVLSGTCSERVLTEAMEGFRPVGIDRMILTKLDEAIGLGVILTCLQQLDAKLSYVTTGQDVPDDIEIGESGRMARLIMGDALRGSSHPTSQTG